MHRQALANRDISALPSPVRGSIKHAPRRDTRPPGSRVRKRKTEAHSDFGIEVADCADFGRLYAPEEAEKPSQDALWARGRHALFEQRLCSEPIRDDRTLNVLRAAFSSAQQPPVVFVPCPSCHSGRQAVIVISTTATIKLQVPFVACSSGCVSAQHSFNHDCAATVLLQKRCTGRMYSQRLVMPARAEFQHDCSLWSTALWCTSRACVHAT